MPDLTDPRLDRVAVAYDDTVGWLVVTRGSCRIAVNLTHGKLDVPLDVPAREPLLATGGADPADRSVRLAGQSVAVVR